MKTHLALGVTMAVCLGLSPLGMQAADAAAQKRPLTIPVTVANRPTGGVACQVTLGPAVPVNALAFSPTQKILAVGGYREVLLWDLSAGKLARRIAAGGYVGRTAVSQGWKDAGRRRRRSLPIGGGAVSRRP